MTDHTTPPPGITNEHLVRRTHRRLFTPHECSMYHVMPDGTPQNVYKLRDILRSVPDRIYAYVDKSGAVMLTGSSPELEPYPYGVRLCSKAYLGTLVCAIMMLRGHNHARIEVEDGVMVYMDRDHYVVLASTARDGSPQRVEMRLFHESKMEHYINELTSLYAVIITSPPPPDKMGPREVAGGPQ